MTDWFALAQHILTDGEIEDALHQAVIRKAPERAGDLPAWFAGMEDGDIEAILNAPAGQP